MSRPAPGPDVTWAYGDHSDQIADIYLPRGARRGLPIVLVHGGYWRPDYDRCHLRPMAFALAEAGRLVVSLEFRRIPGNPDATVDDLTAALRALPGLLASHDAHRFVLVGHSAGGHLALLVSHHSLAPDLAGSVALAPVADLLLAEQWALDDGAVTSFLGGPARDRPDLDPTRLPRPDVPVVVLHGADDSLVPLSVSRSFVDATGVALQVLPDCGHFELIDPASQTWPAVSAAFDLAG